MKIGRPSKKQNPPEVAVSKLLVAGDLATLLERIRRSIAQRAYEFYQARSFQDGHDMDDWFRAEEELCRPSSEKVRQSDDEIVVEVPLPGFSADDVEVGVEPRRLIIWAGSSHSTPVELNSGPAAGAISSENAWLKVLALPAEVDPPHAVAHFSGDTLTVEMPKGA